MNAHFVRVLKVYNTWLYETRSCAPLCHSGAHVVELAMYFKGHLQWKSYLYFLLHKYV